MLLDIWVWRDKTIDDLSYPLESTCRALSWTCVLRHLVTLVGWTTVSRSHVKEKHKLGESQLHSNLGGVSNWWLQWQIFFLHFAGVNAARVKGDEHKKVSNFFYAHPLTSWCSNGALPQTSLPQNRLRSQTKNSPGPASCPKWIPKIFTITSFRNRWYWHTTSKGQENTHPKPLKSYQLFQPSNFLVSPLPPEIFPNIMDRERLVMPESLIEVLYHFFDRHNPTMIVPIEE